MLLKIIDNSFLEKDDFHTIIHYECERSKRSNIQFSLILITIKDFVIKAEMNKMLKKMISRLRVLDQIGYYDERTLGVLLPGASHENARLKMDKITGKRVIPENVIETVEIYTFPDQWMKS